MLKRKKKIKIVFETKKALKNKNNIMIQTSEQDIKLNFYNLDEY